MKKRKIVLAIFILLAISFFTYYEKFYLSEQWLDLKTTPLSGDDSSLTYKDAALFQNDGIPLPDVKEFKGKMKFLKRNSIECGYLIDINIEKLNKNTIPEKYRKKEKISNGFEIMPLDEVSYAAHLEIVLQDKDGFELMHLTGPTFTIESGKNNKSQGECAAIIPFSIAKETKQAKGILVVDKCLSCDPYAGWEDITPHRGVHEVNPDDYDLSTERPVRSRPQDDWVDVDPAKIPAK